MAFFTYLLLGHYIGGVSYASLVFGSFLVGFIIHFSQEIREIDFKNLKLILREAKQVKEQIQEMGLSVVKLISTHSTYTSGSWKQKKSLNDQLEKTLHSLVASNKQVKNIMYPPRIMEKMMRYGKTKLNKKEQKVVEELFSLDE